MGSGSIAFLSTTLPSYTSPAVNLTTLRSSAVGRSVSIAASPVTPRLFTLRNFSISLTDCKINTISSLHNSFNVTTARAISRASASSMASSFSLEKARVPSAIELPVPPVSKFKIGLCQLSVTADKERNIAHARCAIEEAADDRRVVRFTADEV